MSQDTLTFFSLNEAPSRKRETVSRQEAEDAIESLEQEIENLEGELHDKQSVLSDLQKSLRGASLDQERIPIGPGCLICREFEPMRLKTYCSECQRKIEQLGEMGKTPEQICGARDDLITPVSRLVQKSEAAP